MLIERIREEVEQKHISFEQALENVRATSVFTTHTPVPAGHDVFSTQLVEKYFPDVWDSLKISRDKFMELGQTESNKDFNMTVLGLKLANHCTLDAEHDRLPDEGAIDVRADDGVGLGQPD